MIDGGVGGRTYSLHEEIESLVHLCVGGPLLVETCPGFFSEPAAFGGVDEEGEGGEEGGSFSPSFSILLLLSSSFSSFARAGCMGFEDGRVAFLCVEEGFLGGWVGGWVGELGDWDK